MSDERFTLDTNILVYAVDRLAGPRHQIAMCVMEHAHMRPCVLTLQAISEFYAAITRKQRVPRPEAAMLANHLLDIFPTATASESAVRSGLAQASSGLHAKRRFPCPPRERRQGPRDDAASLCVIRDLALNSVLKKRSFHPIGQGKHGQTAFSLSRPAGCWPDGRSFARFARHEPDGEQPVLLST